MKGKIKELINSLLFIEGGERERESKEGKEEGRKDWLIDR